MEAESNKNIMAASCVRLLEPGLDRANFIAFGGYPSPSARRVFKLVILRCPSTINNYLALINIFTQGYIFTVLSLILFFLYSDEIYSLHFAGENMEFHPNFNIYKLKHYTYYSKKKKKVDLLRKNIL